MNKKLVALLGDIHGNVDVLNDFYEYYKDDVDLMIQLGDFGVGFKNMPEFYGDLKFIRGNHDSPEEARKHPNYLGDYGYLEEYGIFYIGGAWSIDWEFRKPYVSWWPDEQLSDYEFGKAFDLYLKVEPRIVVSHESPKINHPYLLKKGLSGKLIPNTTCKWLDMFHEAWRPDKWIHGHWHQSTRTKILGTEFICLDINEALVLEL